MNILTFDTCFNKTYIVLIKDDKLCTYKTIQSQDGNYHSVFLIPELKNILKENELLIKDLAAIGVNIGPGSFTGIRAGITIARVLCQQFNIKLIGVSSLRILSMLNSGETLSILDARKNKVYFAKYDNGKEIISPCLKEKVELINIIKDETVITDNSTYNYLHDKASKLINFEQNDKDIGIYLAQIVKNELKEAKDDYNWAKVKPLYIQPPSITKPKEQTNV